MKKIVKLTEADLYRIVNRVLNEQPQTGQTQNLSDTTKLKKIKDYDVEPGQTGKPNPFRPKPGQQPNTQQMSSMKENEDEELFATHDYQGGKYYDTMDRRVDSDIEFSEKREFGPEDYDSFMEYINNCDTRWCITTKRMYDAYASKGNITVGKGKRKVTEGDDEDYDMLPEMPSEIYKEFIDKVINNVVKLFNMNLEDGHITGTYSDVDVFVNKMEYDLNELFMDFMEEENLSDETLNELNEYANYMVEKTVDLLDDTVKGMDSPEQFEY